MPGGAPSSIWMVSAGSACRFSPWRTTRSKSATNSPTWITAGPEPVSTGAAATAALPLLAPDAGAASVTTRPVTMATAAARIGLPRIPTPDGRRYITASPLPEEQQDRRPLQLAVVQHHVAAQSVAAIGQHDGIDEVLGRGQSPVDRFDELERRRGVDD